MISSAKKMQQTPATIGSSTYQKIKHDIIFGELEPGSKLKLEALKQRYSTSPSTLRETLSRVASEGFVEAPEQRGFRVTPVSKEDMVEIGGLRVLLECHALKLSIENGDTDWEGNLVAAHHKLHLMEQKMLAGDESEKETWKRYDWEFHLAMIQASNNANLLSLHAIMYDKYGRYQLLVLTHRGEIAAQEHKDMFDAALCRDTKAACHMLENHINNGVKHTLAAMEE